MREEIKKQEDTKLTGKKLEGVAGGIDLQGFPKPQEVFIDTKILFRKT